VKDVKERSEEKMCKRCEKKDVKRRKGLFLICFCLSGCSELVARYFALLVSGRRRLPHNVREIAKEHAQREGTSNTCELLPFFAADC
jgi:hypothetical protein